MFALRLVSGFRPSGIRPFGFLCFQNTKNPLKIQKTFETCNLETQVYFPEN